MTFPNHGIKSALIVYPLHMLIGIYITIPLMLIAMYLGMRPDIEKVFRGEPTNSWEGWYDLLHDPERKSFFGIKQKYIPFQNLHIKEDKIMHNPNPPYGWYWWGYLHEVIQDIPLAFIIYVEVMRWL